MLPKGFFIGGDGDFYFLDEEKEMSEDDLSFFDDDFVPTNKGFVSPEPSAAAIADLAAELSESEDAYFKFLEDNIHPIHPNTILLWCTKKDWCFLKDLEKHTPRNEMYEYIFLDDPRYQEILNS